MRLFSSRALVRAIKIAAVVPVVLTSQWCEAQTLVRVNIGTTSETIACTEVEPGARLRLSRMKGTSAPLVMRFVIPDDLEKHAVDVELRMLGTTVSRRAGFTSGIGRRSVVLPALRGDGPVELVNRSAEALWFESIGALADSKNEEASTFTLALLMNRALEKRPGDADALDQLTTTPGVQVAAGFEYHFARLSDERLHSVARAIREICDAHHVPAVVSPCSWWAGTPREVFTRPEFQQVCWSPAEDPGAAAVVRPLLGVKYTAHFGLTTPNMWANTPWQTMNNAELNELRRTRLLHAVPILRQELGDRIAGYVSENEPAYWAWEENDYKYPVKRQPLWADFNPSTVADAQRDGVLLNPEDGLSLTERMWLHENAARYVQRNVDDLSTASRDVPIYSHALLGQHFPLQDTGHYRPYAEIARVNGAGVGLELLRTANFDALWRVRDWGAWGCVNREENDGVAIEYHRGMLQLVYALGADLFQTYNWEGINQDGRAIGYLNDFLASVRAAEVKVGARATDGTWKPIAGQLDVPLEATHAFPWASELSLHLRASDASTSIAVFLTSGATGPVLTWHNVRAEELPTTGPFRIDFGDMIHLEPDEGIALHIRADAPGWEVLGSAEGPDYQLTCDLMRQRTYSRAVTNAAKK